MGRRKYFFRRTRYRSRRGDGLGILFIVGILAVVGFVGSLLKDCSDTVKANPGAAIGIVCAAAVAWGGAAWLASKKRLNVKFAKQREMEELSRETDRQEEIAREAAVASAIERQTAASHADLTARINGLFDLLRKGHEAEFVGKKAVARRAYASALLYVRGNGLTDQLLESFQVMHGDRLVTFASIEFKARSVGWVPPGESALTPRRRQSVKPPSQLPPDTDNADPANDAEVLLTSEFGQHVGRQLVRGIMGTLLGGQRKSAREEAEETPIPPPADGSLKN